MKWIALILLGIFLFGILVYIYAELDLMRYVK